MHTFDDKMEGLLAITFGILVYPLWYVVNFIVEKKYEKVTSNGTASIVLVVLLFLGSLFLLLLGFS